MKEVSKSTSYSARDKGSSAQAPPSPAPASGAAARAQSAEVRGGGGSGDSKLQTDLGAKALQGLKSALSDEELAALHAACSKKIYLKAIGEAGGAASLAAGIQHAGGAAGMGAVLEAAGNANLGVADLRSILQDWQNSPFSDAQKFASAIRLGKQKIDIHKALTYAGEFQMGNSKHKGGGPPADPHPSIKEREVKHGKSPKPTKKKKVRVAKGDMLHYESGHVFGNFALTTKNINRSSKSSFFNPGTNVAAEADATLEACRGELQGWLDANENFQYQTARKGSYKAGFAGGPGFVRMVQFYPTAGAIMIYRNALKAIRELIS